MDKATSDLKNTNVRLKDTVNQVTDNSIFSNASVCVCVCCVFVCVRPCVCVCERERERDSFTRFNRVLVLFQLRSSRNFCIDIILLCIILGIAAYLYK